MCRPANAKKASCSYYKVISLYMHILIKMHKICIPHGLTWALYMQELPKSPRKYSNFQQINGTPCEQVSGHVSYFVFLVPLQNKTLIAHTEQKRRSEEFEWHSLFIIANESTAFLVQMLIEQQPQRLVKMVSIGNYRIVSSVACEDGL